MALATTLLVMFIINLFLLFFFFFFQEEMDAIVALIDKDLSEPYSILTYRYFVYNWSQV